MIAPQMRPPIRRIDGPHQELLTDGTEVTRFSDRELFLFTADRVLQALSESHQARVAAEAASARAKLVQEDLTSLTTEVISLRTGLDAAKTANVITGERIEAVSGGVNEIVAEAVTRGMNSFELALYKKQESRREKKNVAIQVALLAAVIAAVAQFLQSHTHF